MRSTLSAIALVAWSGCALGQAYTATQLGLLPGGTFTEATAINNAGQIDGTADDNISFGPEHSVVLWNGTTPTIIQHGGGIFGFGTAGINNSGAFVGFIQGGHIYPAMWNGPPGYPDGYGEASGINDSGQIVGGYGHPPCDLCFDAALWASPSVAAIFLPTLGGALNQGSFASGINAAGTIVGVSYFSDGTQHATLWSRTAVTDLGTLGGASGEARAINASGRTVGWSTTTSGAMRGTFWYREQIKELGTLGGNTSTASGINAAGNIVGSAETEKGISHAALWRHAKGKPIDLNTEIGQKVAQEFTLTEAAGINDDCSIVANGYNNATGVGVSFVLFLRHQSKCRRCERAEHREDQAEQRDRKEDCERHDDVEDASFGDE